MLAVPWYFTGVIGKADLFAKCYLLITALSLLWGVYAGTLIDRYNRKHVFMAINTGGLLSLSIITGIGFYTGEMHWMAAAAVFATTVFIYNIHFPNLYAFAQEITPRKDYGRITSLLEIQGQVTFTLAGGIAAALMQGFDGDIALFGTVIYFPFKISAWKIEEIFLVNTIAYAITLFLISRINFVSVTDKTIDTSKLTTRLKTGFNYLRQHPLLFNFGNTSLLMFLTILVFGNYISGVYVKNFLHSGGAVYALSDMAFSIGSLIAGILSARIFGEKNAIKGIIILALIAAAMYGFMMFNRVLWLFYAANFVIGASNASIRIQRVTYLFHHIPNHVIGRTNSVFFVCNVFLRLCLIGIFNLPFFLQGEQVIYAVGTMSAICLIMAALLAANYKRLILAPEVAP